MSEYQYQVTEKSLSQGFLIRNLWNPILSLVPEKVTPNSITIFGFAFMILSGVSIALTFYGQQWGFLAAPLCLFVYMACDNIDGIHARRTGQSSRLGEFLDHWLDSISSIIVNSCIALALGMKGWVLAIYLITMGMAFFATIWEHHHTGVFYSGRMGTNEALLTLMGFYVLLFFFSDASWFRYHPEQLTVTLLMATVSIVISTFTFASCMWRVKKHLVEWIPPFLTMCAVAAWLIQGHIPSEMAAILILSSNTIFSGGLIVSHLIERPLKYRNILGTITAIAMFAMLFVPSIPQQTYNYSWIAATVALSLMIVTDGALAVYHLTRKN